MLDSFLIGITVNLVTEAGRMALTTLIKAPSLSQKIEDAYSRALKQTITNKDIRESEQIWSQVRFQTLIDNILNPGKEITDPWICELIGVFETELQKDTVVWNYIQSAVFKTLIAKQNATQDYLEVLIKEVKSQKIDQIELIERASHQAEFQIKKNIASGKYIPETFLEIGEFKDLMRGFAVPNLFYDKIYNEARTLNFDRLRNIQLRQGNTPFEFDIADYEAGADCSFSIIYDKCTRLHSYLDQKYDELYNGKNRSWASSHKVRDKREYFKYIASKIALITANAGQGKTNFICDFVSNVLLKRETPCIYLNGYEIDANDIAGSLSKRLYSIHKHSFADILDVFSTHCRKVRQPLVIIIDGLNENTNPRLFCENIQTFLSELLRHDFIKVILTCRTEYYNHNYSSIGNLFATSIIQIDHIHSRLNDSQGRRIIDNYLSYFKVKTKLSKSIAKEFTGNILLLRIFAEACQGQVIQNLRTLYKDEIFEAYYKRLINDIEDKLSGTDAFKVKGKIQIQNFIQAIIEHMITSDVFANVPLDQILGRFPSHTEVYNRFLDENILLRKDLTEEKGAFGDSEVVNFTYDEFRDYLISSYLVNKIHKTSPDGFRSFVERHTDNTSYLAEGIRSFLFLICQKSSDGQLRAYIQERPWYDKSFLNLIWSLRDEYVKDDDIERLKGLFNPSTAKDIVFRLVFHNRWDKTLFPKLNISTLFEILNQLDDNQLYKSLHSLYAYNDGSFEYKYGNSKPKIEDLIDELEEILLNNDVFFENPESHNLYQYLAYFVSVSHSAGYIYEEYLTKYKNIAQARTLAANCASESLKREINQIIASYEMSV